MIPHPPILTFFFLQGFEWKGRYFHGQQLPSPDRAPQGFVRWERDGRAWYRIAEFVDGKWHGHDVEYDSAGDVLREWDCLRGVWW